MRLPLVMSALALAACDAPSQSPQTKAPEPTGVTVETAAPSEPATVAAAQSSALPRPWYIGRWAVSADMCTNGWWRFWNDEVLTAGELSCAIVTSTVGERETAMTLNCIGDGTRTREAWRLTREDDGRMQVVRDEAPAVTLKRCV